MILFFFIVVHPAICDFSPSQTAVCSRVPREIGHVVGGCWVFSSVYLLYKDAALQCASSRRERPGVSYA